LHEHESSHPEHTLERDPVEILRELLSTSDAEALIEWFETLEPGETARLLSELSEKEQGDLLHLLDPEDAADLIDDLPDEQSADLLEDMPSDKAADIVEALDSDDRADVLAEMEEDDAEAILEAMEDEEAKEARELLSYPMDTAGGVMVKEYVSYPLGTSVGEVLDDLRHNRDEYVDYDVRYFYVTDRNGVLKGVLRLRDMMLSSRSRPIDEVMIADPDVVPADLDLTTLQHRLETRSYSALPVVDRGSRLIGVVSEKEVAEAARKSANRTLLKLGGIFSGEELRSMPTWSRVRGRLLWLLVVLCLSMFAAMVIKFFEGTLRAQIGLAMFLPVAGGLAGSSGNQAIALSLREMAMGVVKPRELMYVLLKETKIGLINGVILGLILMVVSYVLSFNRPPDQRLTIAVIIGLALMVNTFVSVCLGGTLPLVLKRMGMDPATGSGPILTSVIDTCGFFMVLSLAALVGVLRGG